MNRPSKAGSLSEPFRPRLHFSAARGWINDPNGLIVVDGRFHAFFQHEPDATVHGPMHWGHAVSDDLVHWEERPIALHPDALGQCYSGSAVEMPNGDIALLYTAHLDRDGQDALETQCLVRADRALTRFERHPGNPVLGNERGLRDFRDPKVFFHAPTERWIMVLTHGRCAGFFGSDDLMRWTPLGEFGLDAGAPGPGPWECPDLVEITGADGTSCWVLIIGILDGGPGGGSGTQCFVGDFDGTRFTCRDAAETVRWLDHGRDWYAAQSFAGRAGEAPLLMAWASNWQYANRTPTRAFRGALSLPRELSLEEGPDGPEARLVQRVPALATNAFETLHEGELRVGTDEDGISRWAVTPSSGTWRLQGTLALEPGERASIRLFGEDAAPFTLDRAEDGVPAIRLRRDARLGAPLENGPDRISELATDRRVRLDGAAPSAVAALERVDVPVRTLRRQRARRAFAVRRCLVGHDGVLPGERRWEGGRGGVWQDARTCVTGRWMEGEVAFHQLHGSALNLFGRGPLARDEGRPDATPCVAVRMSSWIRSPAYRGGS